MAYVYGGSDTTNQSWGTGKTRCRVQGVLSSTNTKTTVTIDGAVQSISPYTMTDYGVRVTIGHKGGGGVSAGSTYKDGVFDYTAWVASAKKAWSFPRRSSAYKVTIYCSYDGKTVSGYGAAPVEGTVSTTVTIPALPVYKPSAVTAASATRNSDTQVTVKWTNHATTTAPYSGVYVYRQTDGGSWVKIATASGSATSYVDKGTTANHYYAYRMRPYNSAGSASSYGTTGTVYMTPSAPANFTAKLQQGSNILLSWTTNAVTASNMEIEGRSKTGDAWGDWADIVTLAAGTTSYTRTGAPGGTVQYRIRTVRTSPALQSSWVESNETVTIQPPAAPTLTNLPSANIAEGTASVVLSWKHNSIDTSDQTKAEIVVTGAISQTYTVTGSASTYSLNTASLLDGQSVTYKVRTWGADEDASPYSTTYMFTFRALPDITIINPPDDGYVLEQLPLNVQWAFSNGSYSLVSWQADILDLSTGSSVYSVSGTSVKDIVISKNTYMPSNGGSYRLQIRVIASTGLSATESRDFVVDYDEPAPPIIDGEFDQSSLKTVLSIGARNIEGMPTTESLQLYRVMTEDASDVRYANLVSGLEDPVNGILTVDGGYADIYNYVVAGKSYYVGFDYVDGGADYWSAFIVDPDTGDVKADQIYCYPTESNYGILRVEDMVEETASGSQMAIRFYNGAPSNTSDEPMVLTGLRVYEVDTYPEYDSRLTEATEDELLSFSGAYSCPPYQVKAYGQTRQNLWVNPSGTNGGVTVTANDDGTITVEGTATSYAVNKVTGCYFLKPGATYTISVDHALADEFTGTAGGGFDIALYDELNSYITDKSAGFGTRLVTSITVPDNARMATLQVLVRQGTTVSGTYRVMLNEGSTAQPWCPPGINGVEDLALVTAGKNLLSFRPDLQAETKAGITFTPLDDGGVLVNGTATSTAYYNLDFAGSYPDGVNPAPKGARVVSSGRTDGINLAVSVFVPGGSYAPLEDISGYSGVVPEYAKNFRCYLSVSQGTAINNVAVYPQIELGAIATEFEQPQVTKTTVDLQGHALHSLPDGTRDELHVDSSGAVTLVKRVGKAFVDGENYSFIYFDSSTPAKYAVRGGFDASAPIGATGYKNILCDVLPPGDYGNVENRVSMYSGSACASVGTDLASANEWAKNRPITWYYELAAEQTIELGSIDMPELPASTTNVWMTANSTLTPELSMQYMKQGLPGVPAVPDVEYSLPIENLSGTNIELLSTNEVADTISINDNVPQLNSYVLYKLSAISDIGTVSNSYVKVFTDSRRKYAVNWGDDLSDVVIFEPGVTYKESPKRTANTYYPSGRKYGVSFDGENFEESISFSADLIDIDTVEDSERDYRLVREMIASDTNKVMRIPNGSVFYISTPSPEFSYDGNNWYRTMSFNTEVVDGSSPTVINWRR